MLVNAVCTLTEVCDPSCALPWRAGVANVYVLFVVAANIGRAIMAL